MEVVILAVFTCSSRFCLAEMSFRLDTDPPCQSASRCVYHAAFYRMGKTAEYKIPAGTAHICIQGVLTSPIFAGRFSI